ncbi:MAG: hypothetical protein ACYC41_09465 [Bacillota bacterium]
MDDRFGLAILLELFRDLDGQKVPGDEVAGVAYQRALMLNYGTTDASAIHRDAGPRRPAQVPARLKDRRGRPRAFASRSSGRRSHPAP